MKFLTILITLLCFAQLYAQVNIEKYNNLNKSNGMKGKLTFYASAKTGNSDIQEFGVDGRINYRGDKFFSFLIGQGEYGWNKGSEYSNNALLHFRYLRELDKMYKPEFFTQINYNKSRLLLFRSLVGGGLRFDLISDSVSNLTYGSAYMFEYEEIDLTSNAIHSKNTSHHRWSNYISYSNSFSENSRISIVVYAQPRFDNLNDIRLITENHLGVGLTDKLSLSLNLSLRYDSDPPDGAKDLDTNTKLGLTINL